MVQFAIAGMALTSLAPMSAASAQTAAAQQASPSAVHRFNVPAGDLATALNTVAEQAHVLLSLSADLVGEQRTAGLHGDYTVDAAFSALLSGTRLVALRQHDGSYSLRARTTTSDASTLPAVTVQGDREGASEGSGRYTSAAPLGGATPLGLSLKETPQSVSVITKQRMEDQGLNTIADVMAHVPGIKVATLGTERSSFESRGYSIDNYQLDGVNTSSLYQGLAARAPQSAADMALYDRIEVLRGASGLMSGAGDPSGTINLVRKKPTSEFQGSLEAGIGSWGQKRGVLDLSGSLNEAHSLRGRFVAAWQDGESFIDNYSSQKEVFYGVLEADLSETTRLTVGIDHQRGNTKGAGSYLGFPLWYSDGTQTDLPRSFSGASRDNRFDSRNTTLFATLEQELGNEWRLKVSGNRFRTTQEEVATFLNTAGGFPDRVTGNGLTLAADQRRHRVDTDSVDVNVKGPVTLFGRRHELVFGADYQQVSNSSEAGRDQSGLRGSAQNLTTWSRTGTGQFGSAYAIYDNPMRQSSLYGAGRFALSDRLKFIVGTKVFRYASKALEQNVAGYYNQSLISKSAVWTPYGGLVFDIDGAHTAYASYSTIFKPQSAQDRFGQVIAPREGTNYEIGLKSDWLDKRLNTAIALYQIRQDNLTEADAGYFVPGTTTSAYRAVKGAKTQGVDMEVNGEITKSWNVSASWTYTQSKNAKGERITTTFPAHMVKLWTTYHLPGDLNRMTIGGGVDWSSKTYSTADAWQLGRNLYWEQKAYALVNLMARYEFNDKLSATLNINNLFDKKYIASVSDWWYSGYYGAPRNAMLNVKYKF